MNTIQNKFNLSEDRKLSFIKKKLSLIKKIDSTPKRDGNIVKSIIFPSSQRSPIPLNQK